MIKGVVIEKLDQICDERGKVMHMLRCDSPYFEKFGEVYFSVVNGGAVKAWKKHLKMTQYLTVPIGKIKLVIYDAREESSSKGKINEIELGEDEKNYALVKIPPFLWYGFKDISDKYSLIANCTDLPHDPEEVERLSVFAKEIPYTW